MGWVGWSPSFHQSLLQSIITDLFMTTNSPSTLLLRSLETTLTLIPATILIIASLQFIFGSHITAYTLPVSVFFSLAISFFWLLKQKHPLISIPLVVLAISLLFYSYYISNFFLDFSYDGQAYHTPSAILLSHGWNPFYYPDFFSYLRRIPHILPSYIFAKDSWLLYAYNYPHAFENMIAAAMLFFRQPLINPSFYAGVFFTSLFLVSLRILNNFNLPKLSRILLAIAITLNPILDVQFSSACVDGILTYALTIIILYTIDYILNEDLLSLTIAALTCILLINIKYTGLVFAVFFSIGFCLYFLKNKSWKQLKTYALVMGICGTLGFAIIGYQPYITNITQHNLNVFYPTIAKDKSNIDTQRAIEGTVPADFLAKNRFEKFFLSIFAKRINENDNHPIIQFPYTGGFNTANARYGGFGPIFGLEFCLALLLIFFIKNRTLLYTCVLMLISAFIIGEAWWARYVPQIWLVPLFIATDYLRLNEKPIKSIMGSILLLLAITNILNMGWGFTYLTPPKFIKNYFQKTVKKDIAYIFPATGKEGLKKMDTTQREIMQNNNNYNVLFLWAELEQYGVKNKFTPVINCHNPFTVYVTNPKIRICVLPK